MPSKYQPVSPKITGTDARRVHTRLASLAQLPEKGRIEHVGYIQSVSYSAPGSAPQLSADVVDQPSSMRAPRGTVPHIRLRFMGQKSVPGIRPGVKIEYSGMVAPVEQIPTIYNPRYIIVPVARG
ncbi:hypothetical protein AUR04nite_30530 [Glutamicibacter uratoxydans]|uniref:Uncharacterized protein n=1 Tax=Glutamicibacter uratoxydans TaxID=43667 RepID=A0A4Y4DYS3_GLUUR|nr:hypothetical protein [Glutamicibacter uratoxydans]GED07521.1 hypothetical protein AUR04nite_30530 [Glutamicibacter uratoxydans]